MEKRKVIIDCDPGIDDSLALLYALKNPHLDVLGITIVCGNVPTKMGAENALKVLDLLKRFDIPVYLGALVPLERKLITAEDTHGEDGLGETNINIPNMTILDDAVSFIIDTLNKNSDVSIIALGPLTNIALALQKDKDAFIYLDEFVSMGGSYLSHGNCSPVAEFNYWVDPHAAQYVYEHLGHKIHMVGLDVTRKIVLTPNILELISRFNNEISLFIKDITRFYIDFHYFQEGIIGCVINDPLAVAYFVDRDLCSGFDSNVEICTEGIALGQTIVDVASFYQRSNNACILTEVDDISFMKHFLITLFPHHENQINRLIGHI